MDTFQSISVGAAQVAACNSTKPEWIRVPDAIRIFGICRSSIYDLIASGQIKTTCLKKRGALRGVRLISFDSLNSYIEASAEGSKE